MEAVRQNVRDDGLWNIAFAMVLVAGFFDTLSLTVMFPILPKFAASLPGGSAAAIGIIVGASNFSALFARPLSGLASDRWGRRRLLLIGSAIATVSLLGLLVEHLTTTQVVSLRLLHGAGEATFYVGAVSLITDIAPTSRRGEAISLYSVAFLCGLAVGPILGEATYRFGYTAVWLLAAAFAIVAAGLAVSVAGPSGAASDAMSSAQRLTLAIPTAPVLPGCLFAASLFGYAGFAGFIALFAVERSLSGAGWLFAAYGLTVGAVRVIGARWPDRIGPERAGMLALLMATIGLITISLSSDGKTLLLGTMIFASGQALCFPSFMMIALRGSSDYDRGVRVGVFSAFLDVGIGLGSLAFGFVGGQRGYAAAFAIAAGVDLVSAAFLFSRVFFATKQRSIGEVGS
jgi:MFS family permease